MSLMYKITVPRNERGALKIARLNISVGQEYHEGEKMIAVCEWVARNFDQSVVNMCDSLQRHNFEAKGMSSDDAYQKAILSGDEWMKRNKGALDLLPHKTIMRWDQWRASPYWKQSLTKTAHLYRDDAEFKRIIDDTAEAFARRQNSVNVPDPLYSRRYLLEEVAFSMISSFKDIADVYPGTFPPIFDYMRDKGLPAPISMTTVSFKRRKSKEQQAA